MSEDSQDEQERYEDHLREAADVVARYLDLWQQIHRPRMYERPILVDRLIAVQMVDNWVRGHPETCWDAVGMSQETFSRLSIELEDLELVAPTRHLPVQVKVAFTLWMLRHGAHMRELRAIFQLSLRTAS